MKHKQTKLQGEIDKFTTVAIYFNIFLSNKKKIKKLIQALDDTINNIHEIHMYRAFHLTTVE